MSRSKRRTSRVLVAFLVLTICGGVYAAFKKFGSAKGGSPLVATSKNPIDKPNVSPQQIPSVPKTKPEPIAVVANPSPTSQPVATGLEPITKKDPPKTETTPPTANDALAEGRTKFEAGQVAASRKILNEALASGRFQGSDVASAKELLSKINAEAIFSPKLFRDDNVGFSYTVQAGDRLTKIAASNDVTWELLCRINGISDPRKVRALQTLKIIKGPFHAVITKSKFTMDIYLGSPGGAGSAYVTTFPVGLGKHDSTPTGTWKAERKLKNPTYYGPRGEGIISADDPKNPLGEFWIGLTGTDGSAKGASSYGIHGTIEPESIGRESSMGCIRLRNEDVAKVYELLVEGKSIIIVRD